MCFYVRRSVVVLSILVLCACSTVSSLAPGKYTPNGVKIVSQTSTTPSPTLSVSVEATNNGTETAPYPSLSSLDILAASLHCTDYIETQWGTGSEEFGFCPDSSLASTRGPYSPKLDARGDLFILDKANQRILRYSGNSIPRVIPIPSSYVLDGVCGYSNRWPNLSVSKDRLFFLFSVRQDRRVDRLAVLSLNGQEERIIDLEAYYPLHSPFMDTLIADRNGGVYLLLPPAGVVHFDADLRPEFRYMGTDDLLIYQGLVVGWDGILYTYSAARDRLDSWGAGNQFFMQGEHLSSTAGVIAATQIVSPTHQRFLGADTQGRLYFRAFERGVDLRFVRVSASGDQRVVVAVPDGCPSSFSLAPDGSLYGTTYSSKNPDPLVKPKIIRCVFEDDQTPTPTP